jgi:hypothetical protein
LDRVFLHPAERPRTIIHRKFQGRYAPNSVLFGDGRHHRCLWTLLIKSIKKKPKSFLFQSEFVFLFVFAAIVFLYTFVMGAGLKDIVQGYRVTFPWILLLIIPRFLKDDDDIHRLNRLLFPIVFLAFVSQLYSYVSGEYFVDVFKAGPQRVGPSLLAVTIESKEAARSASSMLIILYVFSQALFYYFSKNRPFNVPYLILVLLFCIFSVYLTAARGWIISFTTVILLTVIKFTRRESIIQILRIAVLAGVCFVGVTILFPRMKIQMKNVQNRVVTIQYLLEGDFSAGGTLSRIEKRGPKVMSQVIKSPILGWGFTNHYFRYWDGHVGHQSILLNVGFAGYLILNGLFLGLTIKVYRYSRQKWIRVVYGNGLIVFCYVLLGIYIIHSTSVQIWGLHIKYALGFMYALIFTSISTMVYHAHLEKKAMDAKEA